MNPAEALSVKGRRGLVGGDEGPGAARGVGRSPDISSAKGMVRGEWRDGGPAGRESLRDRLECKVPPRRF